MWGTILVLLFQLLGPLIAAWFKRRLEDRLSKAAEAMGPPAAYGSAPEGIGQLFDTAINATPLICVAERAMLRVAKDLALARAEPLWAAVLNETPAGTGSVAANLEKLSVSEIDDVIRAHGKMKSAELFAPGVGSLAS